MEMGGFGVVPDEGIFVFSAFVFGLQCLSLGLVINQDWRM